jgi:hypothetical protein
MQISAVEFLAKMLGFREMSAATSVDYEVTHRIATLLDQFKESSNFVGPVFRFIRECLVWELTMPSTIGTFIPAVMAQAAGQERTAASARAIVLLADLNRERLLSPALDRKLLQFGVFDEFCKEHLAHYAAIMSTDYGRPF